MEPTTNDEVRSAALLAGQNAALQLAVSGADLSCVLDVLVRTGEGQSDGGVLGSVLLLDEDRQHLRHGAAPSLPQAYNAAIDGIAIGPTVGSCGTAAFLDRVTVVTDIAVDPLWANFKDLALAHGLRACWSTPVHSSAGEVLGTFALYYTTPRAPTQHDRRVVELLSNTAAVVIERHHETSRRERLAHALARSEQRMRLLVAASESINAGLTVDEIAGVLTDHARTIIGAHQAVTSLSVSHDWAQAINAVCLSDKYQGWRDYDEKPRGQGIYAEVCRTNQPMRLTHEELLRHPAWRGFGEHAARHPPMRGYLAVPLVGHGGRNLGLVQLSDKLDGGDFAEEDEAILSQLAAIASAGIENARMYAAAQAASQRKDEFLATLAHELRNPLAPIGNALAVLRRAERGDYDPTRLVETMERQLRHLVHLVDDLLDVSRVTSGKIRLVMEPVDLAEICHIAVETGQPQLQAAGHRFTLELPDAPVLVRGDRTRLAQVLTNLLTNAAKYTPDGGDIRLAVESRDRSVVLRITDTGLGIPPEMATEIFEVFTQVGHQAEREKGGLGLGLALVKKLVHMHGGEVSVRSEGLGKGSEFSVVLPALEPQDIGNAPGTEDSPAIATTKGLRVLVVDDNRDAAETLSMLLQLGEHEVQTAFSGPEGLEAARRFRPDAAFLDIGLPGMDGYELARALRSDPGCAQMALIALTGWGSSTDQARAGAAGFDHHLTKPAAPDQVEAMLAKVAARDASSSRFR